MQGCGLSKEMVLKIAIKVVNNTVVPNGLVSTLLVFGAYPCITEFDALTSTITQ